MSKRQWVPDGAQAQGDTKRPRIERQHEEISERIESARHLQTLLIFETDIPRLLSAIKKFKFFLESIVYPTDEDAVPRQRAILRDYLDSQKPRSNDEEAVYLPDVIQAWNYAAQANSDKLFMAASAIVALLLKTLSNHIDFRDNGLLLCKTILQQAQLRLISRGLASNKTKDYLISPCLRILTEIVSFDGGVMARQLYSKRDLTFDMQTLGRNLTLRKALAENPEEDMRRPSIRTNAVRFLLANFKFQSEGPKIDILKQANVMRALMDGIEQDPRQIITEIILHLKTYIVQDQSIPRRSKSYVFNDRNLHYLCQLYRVDLSEITSTESQKPLSALVHELMIDICGSPDAGVVRPSSWYPPNSENTAKRANPDLEIDLGLDSLNWYGNFANGVPIKNHALGEFILSLRPYAYDMERQLLIAIFEAAPELVAFYFHKISANFTFSPKLTTTWIGYAALIFSTVQLPIPETNTRFSQLPPPVGAVIESIMPLPLNQKILRQCIGTNCPDLVKFFAVRIITIAFQKLRAILDVFRENARGNGKLWEQASEKLVDEFTRRCPSMKDVLAANNTLRNASAENLVQREAMARLLSLYFDVTPQVALDQTVDISSHLASALEAIDSEADASAQKELRILELGHLVKIASWSPSMNWWTKPKNAKFTPFMSLLRLVVKAKDEPSDIKKLLESIVRDSGALSNDEEGGITGLDCLIVSLKTYGNTAPTEAVFEFIDDCFSRVTRKTIKYEDDKDALINGPVLHSQPVGPSSLVWLAIIEQWSFVEKTRPQAVEILAHWIARFRCNLETAGERMDFLERTHIILEDTIANVVLRRHMKELCHADGNVDLKDHLHKYCGLPLAGYVEAGRSPNRFAEHKEVVYPNEKVEDSATLVENTTPAFIIKSYLPPPEDEEHVALTAWKRKDADSAIEEGDLSALVLLLSSPDFSIRHQTQLALRNFIVKLQETNYIEKDQIHLLLGELLETAAPILANGNSFPSLAGSWAAKAVGVLVDPTHVLYEKVNEYLNLGPSWWIGKMVGYWTDRIIQHPPSDETDGSYYREIVWLLEWLDSGIRSAEDIVPLRNNGIFERLFSLFAHPALNGYGNSSVKVVELFLNAEALSRESSLQGKIRPTILRIVARAVAVGGSTTLVTRTGVLAWLDIVKSMKWVAGKEGETVFGDLEKAILGGCEQDRVREWSSGLLLKEKDLAQIRI